MNTQDIEKEISEKGLDKFPRVSPQDVEDNIVAEYYFTAGDGYAGSASLNLEDMPTNEHGLPMIDVPEELERLTFCVLQLKNGYLVTGESACVSAENFDAELGKKIARQQAVGKVWNLMGYALKAA